MLDLNPGTGSSNPFPSSGESANFRFLSADDECLSLRPIPLSVRDPCPRDRESNPSPSTAGSANPLSAALRCLSLPCNGSVQPFFRSGCYRLLMDTVNPPKPWLLAQRCK